MPAHVGLFFCFAACVLLVIASVSAPTWNKISFLDVGPTHFGVFGFTGSGTSIGYRFPNSIGVDTSRLNTTTLHGLTKTLILIPIAAGLSGLAVLFGLCGTAGHRAGTIFLAVSSALAFVITLLAWVLEMSLFGIERDRIRDQGVSAQFGNANWLVLASLAALALGFCTGTLGIFGSYRRNRVNRV